MATALVVDVNAKVSWSRKVLYDTGAEWSWVENSSIVVANQLADGTGDSQADLVWAHYGTLASTATYAMDLNALAQVVLSSNVSWVMLGIKAILVKNHNDASTQTGQDLILTNIGVSNAQTDLFAGETAARIVVPAGGFVVCTSIVSEWASGATKVGLELTNTQTETVAYSIAILGTSA